MNCSYCEKEFSSGENCNACGFPHNAPEEEQKNFRMDMIDLEHDLWEIRNIRWYWLVFALYCLILVLVFSQSNWLISSTFALIAIFYLLAFRLKKWMYEWGAYVAVLLFYLLHSTFEIGSSWTTDNLSQLCLQEYGIVNWGYYFCSSIPLMYMIFRLLFLVAFLKGVYKTWIHRNKEVEIQHLVDTGRDQKDEDYYLR